MPVDLHEFAEKLDTPGTLRWLLAILPCTAAGAVVALLLWPGELQPRSLWFWSWERVHPR